MEKSPGLSFERMLSCFGHLTPQLKLWLQRMAHRLAPAEFENIMRRTFEALHGYMLTASMVPAGPERARQVQKWMDEALATMTVPVSCRKGCAACCKFPKQITRDEASLLSAEAQRLGFTVPSTEQKSCMFLSEDGACRAYSVRPMACRKYFVTTPPEHCADEKVPVVPYAELTAELIASAVLSMPETEFGEMNRLMAEAMAAPPTANA